jgi:hypothetical protein
MLTYSVLQISSGFILSTDIMFSLGVNFLL